MGSLVPFSGTLVYTIEPLLYSQGKEFAFTGKPLSGIFLEIYDSASGRLINHYMYINANSPVHEPTNTTRDNLGRFYFADLTYKAVFMRSGSMPAFRRLPQQAIGTHNISAFGVTDYSSLFQTVCQADRTIAQDINLV